MDSGYAAALPLALGAAVSPGLLAIVLLILSSATRPVARAWMYLLGVVTVIVAASLVGLVTLRALVAAVGTPSTSWSVAIKAVLAFAILVVGWQYLRRARGRSPDEHPWLQDRLRTASVPVFYALGIATLLTNWSTILLYLSALEVIRVTAANPGTALLASAIVLLITIGPLLLPVVAVTLAGHRSDRLLAVLRLFADRHADHIIAGVYFVIAALVAGSAVSELTNN
jgi:CBS domain-containing protein